MAMRNAQVTITGTTPLLQNCPQTVDRFKGNADGYFRVAVANPTASGYTGEVAVKLTTGQELTYSGAFTVETVETPFFEQQASSVKAELLTRLTTDASEE
jgi:hypothetical protein